MRLIFGDFCEKIRQGRSLRTTGDMLANGLAERSLTRKRCSKKVSDGTGEGYVFVFS